MKSKEVEEFVLRNIPNFHVNGSGWTELISKMLFELGIAGWDLTSVVGGKEKFGELRCYITHENKELESRAKSIVKKYAEIASKTCEQCGCTAIKRIDKDTQWESTLCKKCYFKRAIEREQRSFKESDYFDLSECKVCGYFALSDNYCVFCRSIPYSSDKSIYKPAEYFKSEDDYIKERQIKLFLDEDNELELSKSTKHFNKSDSHQIIFTLHDLEQFIKKQKDD